MKIEILKQKLKKVRKQEHNKKYTKFIMQLSRKELRILQRYSKKMKISKAEVLRRYINSLIIK